MSKVIQLAIEAAKMKGWPHQMAGAELKVEIPTASGRTQVVVITPGKDADGDPVAFIWSKAADVGAQDPWWLLRQSLQYTYGKIVVRDNEIIVLDGIFDNDATISAVGKSMYFGARNADELESTLSGGADRQ